jgi:shikimate kinase
LHISLKGFVVKEETNIALIGFRASGKSLVGKLLAEDLGLSFVDMDARLVASFGMDIDQWVHSQGWESFRHEESELLAQLAREQGLVVATGGGVVLSALNRNLLRSQFLVVWLKASPEATHLRMLGDPHTGANRPALTTLPIQEEIRQILAERSDCYQDTAHIILETDNALPAQLVLEIKRRLASSKEGCDQNAGNFRR